MNLCSKKHEEICYESNDCPLCDEIAAHADTVSDFEKQIEKLDEEILEMKRNQ